jgi:hypothetical protein
VYLEIISGKQRPSLLTVLRNLPIILKVKATAPSQIITSPIERGIADIGSVAIGFGPAWDW